MNVLAFEWIKARSVRSTWMTAIATTGVTVAVSLLGISGLLGEWTAELPAHWDPTANSLKGILVGQILIGMLGAQTISSEYSTGMIATSLAVAPRRVRLLGAKAAVTALLAFVVAVPTVAIAFLTSQAVLSAVGLPAASLGDPGVWRALACAVGYLVLIGMLGMAAAIVTRSSSGALSVIVAVALLAPALTPALPGQVGAFLATWWPTTAGQASYATAGSTIPPLLGLAALALFTLYGVVAAGAVFRRRDA